MVEAKLLIFLNTLEEYSLGIVYGNVAEGLLQPLSPRDWQMNRGLKLLILFSLLSYASDRES